MRIRLIKKLIFKVHARSVTLKTSAELNYYRFAMSGDCKPSVFFVLGAPGSGKGTQCFNVKEKFNFEHLSAGELLRDEQNTPGSPFGSIIAENIKLGKIVPAQITCNLLKRGMYESRQNFFLIDGFPRNRDNVEAWEKEMSDKVNLLGVFFFDCQEDVCIKRCLSRGAAGSGRADDNEESLKYRFVTYKNDTMPIINYYKDQQLLFSFDGNRTPEEVFKDVEKIIKQVAPLSVKK